MNPTAAPAREPAEVREVTAPDPTTAKASPWRRSNLKVAFALLPAEQRDAIRAVHAWSRAVDDSVDEEPNHERAKATLTRWRDDLAALRAGDPADPMTRRLAPYVRQFDIPLRYFEQLVAGVEMDLTRARYETFAELEQYAYHVASVVGLICLHIFGDRDEKGRAYAESLGMALQLTNIIRDVGTDFEHGRVYLPQDELRRFGYDEEALARGERNDAFRRLMQHQAARARRYFQTAATESRGLDRRRFIAAEIMDRVYQRLLTKIEARDFDVFHGEVRVRRIERVWIAATTALAVHLGR